MKYDKELVGEFVIESKEHLCNIEDDFLEMERSCDNLNQQLVDRCSGRSTPSRGRPAFSGSGR